MPTCAVMPVDSPTVAKAETTSKSTWSRVKSASAAAAARWSRRRRRRRAARRSAPGAGPRAGCAGRRRWRCSSPRTSLRMTNSRTAKVVTLMPPAVPALPPPMNISTSVPSSVSGLSVAGVDAVEAGGARLDALEDAGDELAADAQRPEGARVASTPAAGTSPCRRRAGRRSSSATILVCSVQRRGVRHARRSSNSTGKPRPPATTSTHRVRLMTGSVAKPMRLSLNSAKPALLNADTAWKTPSHSGPAERLVVRGREAQRRARAAPAASKSRLVRATPSRTPADVGRARGSWPRRPR